MPSKVRRRPRGRKITKKIQAVRVVRAPRRRALTLSGFPQKKTVRLRYCSEVSLNSAVTGYDEHLFRTNSPFDPDYSGVGHQPKGFDEWAKIYGHYTCMSSKIDVKMVPISTSNQVQGINGILLDTSTTGLSAFSDLADLLESKLCGKNWQIGGNGSIGQIRTNGPYAMKKSFNTKRFFGIKDTQDGSAYSSVVSGNPAHQAYFVLWQYSLAGNDPGVQNYIVTIDYVIEFRDPVSLAGS